MATSVDNGELPDFSVATSAHPDGGVFERPAQSGTGAYGATNVTTTVTLVRGTKTDRLCATLQPLDGDIFVGYDSDLTISNGTLVPQGTMWEERDTTTVLYAVASSGTVDVRWTEV